MSTTYSISHQAYVKFALHAAKYPHKQVTGVFVGKSTGPNAVDIIDAIPLLHLQTNLRLCMEIGMALVSLYCSYSEGCFQLFFLRGPKPRPIRRT